MKALVADLSEILFGNDPPHAAGQGGVDGEEVGPGRVEHKAHVMGIDDLDGLHLRVQELGRDPLVAPEAIFDVFRRERIAIVEGHALT